MRGAYYNEFDPYAARWLRALIAKGLIADGDVDERSIVDVRADDLRGYAQVHLFAGIGGWSYAARLAGWPDERPLWTGSCPCQPFSAAGKQQGAADARHLWPVMGRLVAECAPAIVVGEQVASRLGREWLAGVFADLEGVGYACAGADLCAAGVGAPHIRQRLFWVGLSSSERSATGLPEPPPGEARDAGVVVNTGSTRSAWSPWVSPLGRDGTKRRLEPGLEPLVDGLPFRLADGRTSEAASRKEILKGLGNAIVAQLGAVFLSAISR